MGGTCQMVADLPRSYREARLTLRVRRPTDGQSWGTAFDQLGVYQVLVGSLGRYFDWGRNYDATGHSLLVSGSTLKYRLQRVREISRHDLTDSRRSSTFSSLCAPGERSSAFAPTLCRATHQADDPTHQAAPPFGGVGGRCVRSGLS